MLSFICYANFPITTKFKMFPWNKPQTQPVTLRRLNDGVVAS